MNPLPIRLQPADDFFQSALTGLGRLGLGDPAKIVAPVPGRQLLEVLSGGRVSRKSSADERGDRICRPQPLRRRGDPGSDAPPLTVSASDPLNFRGILTPDERISPNMRQQVRVA